jgi:hypothetical protein
MAAIGRVLQLIGWLWVLVGFIGPRVDLDAFGLDSIGVLPGLILIFIARAFRARARAEKEEDLGQARPDVRPRSVEARPERRQAPPPPAPARTTPSPPAERKPRPEPKVEPPPAEEADLLERIVLAGSSAAGELSAADLEEELRSMRRDDDERKPMSSAEMIAQARRRWDRPGRQ